MHGSAPKGGYDARIFGQLAAVEDRSFWFRSRNRLIVQLVSDLVRPGARFLEIGCGTGYVLRALAQECNLRVTGTELFSQGLHYARQRVPSADIAQIDAKEMPYEEIFDAVGAFDVLEHIDDDACALRGMHRALRPGGHLFLTVPQHPWLWSDADTYACHVQRYSRKKLVCRVEKAGFSVVRVTSFMVSLLPIMVLARWRQRYFRRSYDPIAELVPPQFVSRLFETALDRERMLIARGWDSPVGGSLVLVATRES